MKRLIAGLALTAIAIAVAMVAIAPAGAATTKSASVVKISALPSGLEFNTKELHAKHGKVDIVFTNLSTLDHNVRIARGSHQLGGTKTIGKGKTTAILTLKKGSYRFYCSVPGHEAAGMKGTLTVS